MDYNDGVGCDWQYCQVGKGITENVHCEVGLDFILEIKILMVGGHCVWCIEFYMHKISWCSFDKFI
jgi:hypothetical protein